MRRLIIVLVIVTACRADRSPYAAGNRYALGRAATAQEISAVDDAIGQDGSGLPAGSGTAAQGNVIFQQKCASCHGANGEGKPPLGQALVGRDSAGENFVFALSAKPLTKTIGNYWPHATTLFDYVRRAMPLNAPGSLTNDDVYALTAYLLAANKVIPADATLDAPRLKLVKMPYANRFVADDRRGGHEVK